MARSIGSLIGMVWSAAWAVCCRCGALWSAIAVAVILAGWYNGEAEGCGDNGAAVLAGCRAAEL